MGLRPRARFARAWSSAKIKWVYTMFRKVPHLDDLVFWIGEMHMIMHDDLLTHSWGINRRQLHLRRMDSGGDMAQIQCDGFLKERMKRTQTSHHNRLCSKWFAYGGVFGERSRLHKCNPSIFCHEHHLPARSIKWARDETQLKDFLIAMETDGLQERLLRFEKVMEFPCYY